MAILTNIRYSGCSPMILIRLFYITTILRPLVTDVNGQMCPWSLNTEALPAITGGTPYKSGSKFESNLKALLNNLVQHTPQTGFNTSVYGQSPNRISGLLQCRGDTTVDQCYNCSKLVTSNVKKFCGNGPGCRVFLDLCYLRYENYSFVEQMGDNGCYINVTGNATNPSVSISIVDMLWSKLADEAASAVNRCAFNRTVDSLSRNYIYALAQCTRDISTDDCTTCLSQTINNSLSNYPGSQSLQGLMSSCMVRYETYPFFNSTALPLAPAEAPVQTPPKNTALPLAPAEAPVHTPPKNTALPLAPAEAPVHTPPKNTALPLAPAETPVHTPPKNTAVPLARAEAPAHTSQINPSSKYKIPIILGAVSGFLLILFVCLFAAIFGKRYEGHRQVQEDALIIQDQPIVKFKMKTLLAATKNFHDDNRLGEGGFGPVYKGITQDGKEIAVKKLSLTSRQGRKEFLNEVKLVAKIRHRNVVNILGCCAEGSERLLVYEYLPNRSLDKSLLDPNKPLDWPKRYNIILGVARGLLYLHQDSHLRIIHRDIKASNILLDEKLNPKIADFGLARLFPDDATHITTGAVAGTYGYMAPEYALHGQLSVKVDVYSFGVVLLELVTGRKNTDYNSSSEMQTLLGWAWASYEQGNIEQMVDPAIIETCDKEQALRCIHVGLLCTQAESSLRPSMPAITLMLSPQFVGLPDPTKPAFVISVNQNINSGAEWPLVPLAQVLSNADASITDIVPR